MNKLRPEPMDSSWISMTSTFNASNNQHFDPYGQPSFLRGIAKILNVLSTSLTVKIVENGIKNAGINPRLVKDVNSERLASMITNEIKNYGVSNKIPFVALGAPSGAISFLTSYFNGIFLSQHLLFSFKHRKDPDDVKQTYVFGRKLAREILKNNEDLVVINHYDPLHDRFLVKYVNHIRTKFLSLPLSYEIFLKQHLIDEAPVLVSDVRYSWKQFNIGEENGWFQIGGLGGYSDEEFLFLPEKVQEWLKNKEGKEITGWYGDFLENEENRPESEWGFEKPMFEEIREWANDNGHPLFVIQTDHPEKISQAFLKTMIRLEKIKTVLFSAFIAIDPIVVKYEHVGAYWLPFICEDSLISLKNWIDSNKKELSNIKRIGLALSPNFTNPPDTVPLENWIETLGEIGDISLIGIDKKRYPFDLLSLFSFSRDSKKFVKKIAKREKVFEVTEFFNEMRKNGVNIDSY